MCYERRQSVYETISSAGGAAVRTAAVPAGVCRLLRRGVGGVLLRHCRRGPRLYRRGCPRQGADPHPVRLWPHRPGHLSADAGGAGDRRGAPGGAAPAAAGKTGVEDHPLRGRLERLQLLFRCGGHAGKPGGLRKELPEAAFGAGSRRDRHGLGIPGLRRARRHGPPAGGQAELYAPAAGHTGADGQADGPDRPGLRAEHRRRRQRQLPREDRAQGPVGGDGLPFPDGL